MGIRGDERQIVAVEEVAIINSFEIAALIEVLEAKGILTKAEVLKMIQRLKAKQSSLPGEVR